MSSRNIIKFDDIPVEVMINIIKFLPKENRASLRNTNKKSKHATDLATFYIKSLINKPEDKFKKELELLTSQDLDILLDILNNQYYYTSITAQHQDIDDEINDMNSREIEKLDHYITMVKEEIEKKQKKSGGSFSKDVNEIILFKTLLLIDQTILIQHFATTEPRLFQDFIDFLNEIKNDREKRRIFESSLTQIQKENLKSIFLKIKM
jgi:hypothetical protein